MGFRSFLAGAVALPCCFGLSPARAAGPTFTALHGFATTIGTNPIGGFTETTAGVLYGVTSADSTFFTLTPPAAGKTAWSLKVLYTFPTSGTGGLQPSTTLITDSAGNFYGTTQTGGGNNVGVVYQLVPPSGAVKTWTENVLYNAASADGAPDGKLVSDGHGGLIGTSSGLANGTNGSVFDLTPPQAGQTAWTYTPIHAFAGGSDGINPNGGLIADSKGNFYGTTVGGGADGDGTVFELSPPAAGQTAWTESILYSFSADYGVAPSSPLVAFDGVLYGETGIGSPNNLGEVFALAPPTKTHPTWSISILAGFGGGNGTLPAGGLVVNSAGVLYGVTLEGGATKNYGTVFSLTPPATKGADWTGLVLHNFAGTDGSTPTPLVLDPSGTLYGLASNGGSKNFGEAYRLIP